MEYSFASIRDKLFSITKKKGHYIVSDSYVTMSDGTGIVHCSCFWWDDARVGRQNDLPFVQLVNEDGICLRIVMK